MNVSQEKESGGHHTQGKEVLPQIPIRRMIESSFVQHIGSRQRTNVARVGQTKGDVVPKFIDGHCVQSIPKCTDPLNPREPIEDTFQIDEETAEDQHEDEDENAANVGHR